jgi:outer membrane protein assembly factor BamC
MSRLLLKTIGWCLLLNTISGCSLFKTVDETLPDYRIDYKKTTSSPPLEYPPDLTATTAEEQLAIPDLDSSKTATATDSPHPEATEVATPVRKEFGVLPLSDKVQVKREGQTRWLLLQGTPDLIWPNVRNFWLAQSFELKKEDPRIGIMETEWNEKRANIPQEGIRKVLGKVLDTVYSASTRDKFRVRLERGIVAGTTELYLTHQGAQEVSQGDQFVWQNRPADPELEAEMLNRLMVFLGLDNKQADQLLATPKTEEAKMPRANLTPTATGQPSLLVQDNLASAWQRTGLALDRVGFTVEDRDHEHNVYAIRYIDQDEGQKKGFFARLFSSKSDTATNHQEFLINLKEENQATRIMVLDKEGKTETSKTAEKILTLLQEQLK